MRSKVKFVPVRTFCAVALGLITASGCRGPGWNPYARVNVERAATLILGDYYEDEAKTVVSPHAYTDRKLVQAVLAECYRQPMTNEFEYFLFRPGRPVLVLAADGTVLMGGLFQHGKYCNGLRPYIAAARGGEYVMKRPLLGNDSSSWIRLPHGGVLSRLFVEGDRRGQWGAVGSALHNTL